MLYRAIKGKIKLSRIYICSFVALSSSSRTFFLDEMIEHAWIMRGIDACISIMWSIDSSQLILQLVDKAEEEVVQEEAKRVSYRLRFEAIDSLQSPLIT